MVSIPNKPRLRNMEVTIAMGIPELPYSVPCMYVAVSIPITPGHDNPTWSKWHWCLASNDDMICCWHCFYDDYYWNFYYYGIVACMSGFLYYSYWPQYVKLAFLLKFILCMGEHLLIFLKLRLLITLLVNNQSVSWCVLPALLLLKEAAFPTLKPPSDAQLTMFPSFYWTPFSFL